MPTKAMNRFKSIKTLSTVRSARAILPIALVAMAVSVFVGIVEYGSLGHASAIPTSSTFGSLCNDLGNLDNGLCMQAGQEVGAHWKTEPYGGTSSRDQYISLQLSPVCGGKVTSTCPSQSVFRQWDGAQIAYLLDYNGLCIGDGTNGVTSRLYCGDANVVKQVSWVLAGYSFVNVNDTEDTNNGYFLNGSTGSGGIGMRLYTGSWHAGNSQWAFLTNNGMPTAAHQ